MTREKRKETDLFPPVEQYFSQQGYQVYGEVNDCDVVAVKDNEIIIIELKLQLSIDLLIQASNRQSLSDDVYIAVPKPKYKKNSRKWRDLCNLLQKVGLGFIVIHFLKSGNQLEVIFPPSPIAKGKKSAKKINKLIKEISGRQLNNNIGGSSQTKIMTAYKENCIQIAYYLHKFGPMKPKELRKLGTGEKTQSILYQNYYGWFNKVGYGIYEVNEKGMEEIQQYPECLHYFQQLLDNKNI